MARNSFLCADVPLRNYSLTQLIGRLRSAQLILHSVCGPISLKIRSYPFAYLTISDTCDILFYCVCSSCV